MTRWITLARGYSYECAAVLADREKTSQAIILNVTYYGLVFWHAVCSFHQPALQEQLLARSRRIDRGSTGDGGRHLSWGNVLAAAVLTFVVNLLGGACLHHFLRWSYPS